jgi:hypothetical protein
MYSTCIFCHSSLGTNEAIERFPVGRRLAFDAARGRLWVVCRKCERWNLSPLDERWEAIEECERAFRDTKLRVSTDNIGLGRAREGLELVRVGSPQRPEMAAWRYGDQFGRRRTRRLALYGAVGAVAAGAIVLGPVMGVIAGGGFSGWNIALQLNNLYQQRRIRARIAVPESATPLPLRTAQLHRVAIVPDLFGWALRVPFEAPAVTHVTDERFFAWKSIKAGKEYEVVITGDDAIRAASQLLPALNASGAARKHVEAAVHIIEDAATPDALFGRYTGRPAATRRSSKGSTDVGHELGRLPRDVLLALEMATHEESERRALEGELALLETAWKNAEEIAAISDDMFVTDATRERLEALKRANDTP